MVIGGKKKNKKALEQGGNGGGGAKNEKPKGEIGTTIFDELYSPAVISFRCREHFGGRLQPVPLPGVQNVLSQLREVPGLKISLQEFVREI